MRSHTLMKTFFMGKLPVTNSLNFFKKLNKECAVLANDRGFRETIYADVS